MQLGRWMAAGLMVCASACSSAPTAKGLAQDAVTAMGGADQLRGVQSLVMSGGTGTRNRLGQTVHATDPDGTGKLSNVIEAVDRMAACCFRATSSSLAFASPHHRKRFIC